MFQYIRYDCDSVVAMEARDRVLRHKHRMQLDCRHGWLCSRISHPEARAPAPFYSGSTLSCEVERCGTSGGSGDAVGFKFALSRPTPFQLGAAQLDGHECVIVSAGPDVVSLASVLHVDKGILSQPIVATTPDELGLAFSEFWGPLWNRDPSASSMALDDWAEYRAFDPQLLSLPRVRPLPPVTIEHWQRAIKRMSAKSALVSADGTLVKSSCCLWRRWSCWLRCFAGHCRSACHRTYCRPGFVSWPKSRCPLPCARAGLSRSLACFTGCGRLPPPGLSLIIGVNTVLLPWPALCLPRTA